MIPAEAEQGWQSPTSGTRRRIQTDGVVNYSWQHQKRGFTALPRLGFHTVPDPSSHFPPTSSTAPVKPARSVSLVLGPQRRSTKTSRSIAVRFCARTARTRRGPPRRTQSNQNGDCWRDGRLVRRREARRLDAHNVSGGEGHEDACGSQVETHRRVPPSQKSWC
jgi:hypothetical protein